MERFIENKFHTSNCSCRQQLTGKYKAIAEIHVFQAASNAYKSIGVVMVYIQKCINSSENDPDYFGIINDVEEVCEHLEGKPIAQGVRDIITAALCIKKVGNCHLIKILIYSSRESKEFIYLHILVAAE